LSRCTYRFLEVALLLRLVVLLFHLSKSSVLTFDLFLRPDTCGGANRGAFLFLVVVRRRLVGLVVEVEEEEDEEEVVVTGYDGGRAAGPIWSCVRLSCLGGGGGGDFITTSSSSSEEEEPYAASKSMLVCCPAGG
jgi:hypothetical protein